MTQHKHSSSGVFRDYVDAFEALLRYPLNAVPLTDTPPPAREVDRNKPLALIVSPHPDDECLIGGLALRLQHEAGFDVLNVAATLGSNVGRQQARWHELLHACERLDFATLDPAFDGRRPINPARRAADPQSWARDVARLAGIFDAYRPRLILFPHDADGSATHIGTHALTRDALALYAQPVWLAQTEFWATLAEPNLLVELSGGTVCTMLEALTCHRKEIERNPYHLRLTSWLADSVRRGGETVFGAGLTPPAYPFGALYRMDRWDGEKIVTVTKKMGVGADEKIGAIFDDVATDTAVKTAPAQSS
ncbi:PIG-L family deacetylase [Paraburkholderia sp.]|uniref:PIG-L deacetylase family protein n=1 Tax=Paraburkholderia sp. TaxID=1926495 RepID=UPI00238E9C29|nr:PIG-L family deacetylase [Paraburkholderia sp.]MDE1182378.1 PIG-L family deacetylase [Paraburkholderia sp.]